MVTLAVIGNVNVDLVVWPVSDVPDPGTERAVERIDLRLGGAAAISGATLARLGTAPIVVGCVGADVFGDAVHAELRRYGVDTSHVRTLDGAPTGACIAFEAPGRDRSFLMSLGSLAAFEPSMIPDEAFRASFLLLCGYFNLPSMRGRATADVLHRVKDAGGITVFDTGWDHDGWPEATRDEIRRLLPLVDVFVPNEMEAACLSGEPDPLSAAHALSALSQGSIVVKLGPRGSLAVGADRAVHRARAPVVDVADTTGAGDAFNAGLMHGLGSGEPLDRAITFASALASAVVSRPSSDRYPSRAAVPG